MAQSIVVLERDPKLARSLAGGLRPHFHSVVLTHSRDELRESLSRTSPNAVVFDLEHWRLADVENLHREFPNMSIICTHRIPDEEMWMAALEAGASDVCPSNDVSIVLSSVLRSMMNTRGAAA